MAPQTSTKMTYEDLLLLPEDGLRHEIIDGEHYVNASPLEKHQRVSYNLIVEIGIYLRQHSVGRLYHAPFDVVFSPYDVVEPDLMFISNEHRGIITSRNVQGSPDLLVEILSPSNTRYDEVTKRALYERTGVGEYWIVDPRRDAIQIFRRNAEGRYEIAGNLSRNETLTSPLFPMLEIQLDEIFA